MATLAATASSASSDTRLSAMGLDSRFAIADRTVGGARHGRDRWNHSALHLCASTAPESLPSQRSAACALKWEMMNVATLAHLRQRPYRETWKLLAGSS